MNTKPDEELLALWVEDELDEASAASVEEWAISQPEWVELREQARWSKSLLGSNLPAEEEVPHAEFFNARISREIRIEQERSAPAASVSKGQRMPWAWLMPATAAAGIALGFMLGHDGSPAQDLAPATVSLSPVLYTPEKGVDAEYVASNDATVILLAGVDAIPDDWEIPETAMLEPEPSRMADNGERHRHRHGWGQDNAKQSDNSRARH